MTLLFFSNFFLFLIFFTYFIFPSILYLPHHRTHAALSHPPHAPTHAALSSSSPRPSGPTAARLRVPARQLSRSPAPRQPRALTHLPIAAVLTGGPASSTAVPPQIPSAALIACLHPSAAARLGRGSPDASCAVARHHDGLAWDCLLQLPLPCFPRGQRWKS